MDVYNNYYDSVNSLNTSILYLANDSYYTYTEAYEPLKVVKEHATRCHPNPNYLVHFQKFWNFSDMVSITRQKYFPYMENIQQQLTINPGLWWHLPGGVSFMLLRHLQRLISSWHDRVSCAPLVFEFHHFTIQTGTFLTQLRYTTFNCSQNTFQLVENDYLNNQ